MSAVNIQVQKLTVTDTRDITITDIIEDGIGGYVRSIRFLGEPLDASGNPTLMLEVQVRSANRTDILVDAPGTSY